MSVLEFASGNLFIFRVFKHLATNPDNKWANSYEFLAQDGGSDADLLILVSALVLFEANIHRDTVLFDQVVVSTWEADSVPYDPNTFLSVPQTAQGLVGPVGDQLALNQCLSVARVPSSGRFGHIFYRGVLNEADTEAPAGKLILTDRAGIQGNIDAALETSELDGFLEASRPANLVMAMVDKTGETVRKVNTLTVQGATTLPTDHAWFNRTPAP